MPPRLHRVCLLVANVLFALAEAKPPSQSADPPAPVAAREEPELWTVEQELDRLQPDEDELRPQPDGRLWTDGIERKLRRLAARRSAEARLVARARMVLGVVFERRPIAAVARDVGVTSP